MPHNYHMWPYDFEELEEHKRGVEGGLFEVSRNLAT